MTDLQLFWALVAIVTLTRIARAIYERQKAGPE